MNNGSSATAARAAKIYIMSDNFEIVSKMPKEGGYFLVPRDSYVGIGKKIDGSKVSYRFINLLEEPKLPYIENGYKCTAMLSAKANMYVKLDTQVFAQTSTERSTMQLIANARKLLLSDNSHSFIHNCFVGRNSLLNTGYNTAELDYGLVLRAFEKMPDYGQGLCFPEVTEDSVLSTREEGFFINGETEIDGKKYDGFIPESAFKGKGELTFTIGEKSITVLFDPQASPIIESPLDINDLLPTHLKGNFPNDYCNKYITEAFNKVIKSNPAADRRDWLRKVIGDFLVHSIGFTVDIQAGAIVTMENKPVFKKVSPVIDFNEIQLAQLGMVQIDPQGKKFEYEIGAGAAKKKRDVKLDFSIFPSYYTNYDLSFIEAKSNAMKNEKVVVPGAYDFFSKYNVVGFELVPAYSVPYRMEITSKHYEFYTAKKAAPLFKFGRQEIKQLVEMEDGSIAATLLNSAMGNTKLVHGLKDPGYSNFFVNWANEIEFHIRKDLGASTEVTKATFETMHDFVILEKKRGAIANDMVSAMYAALFNGML